MDPLCGTPCGSAAAQPHVEVAEIKSEPQFSNSWISLNRWFPKPSQDANILAQDEKSAEAGNGRCIPRSFFRSDAGTLGPCDDDAGSLILHNGAALTRQNCSNFFHKVCPMVGVPLVSAQVQKARATGEEPQDTAICSWGLPFIPVRSGQAL